MAKRKQLTDLRNPLTVQELNKQMDALWNMYMGGVSQKSLDKNLKSVIDSKVTGTEFVEALAQKAGIGDLNYVGATLPTAPSPNDIVLYLGAVPNEWLRWKNVGGRPSDRRYDVALTGGAVKFDDLSDNRKLKITVKTVAAQAGSGSPTPSNVRAITGKADATVRQPQGKNLVDPLVVGSVKNGVTLTYDPATQEITLNGTCTTNNTNWYFSTQKNALIAPHVMSLFFVSGSRTLVGSSNVVQVAEAGWVNIRTEIFPASGVGTEIIGSPRLYENFTIRADAGSVFTNYKFKIQIEYGTVGTEWEAYRSVDTKFIPPTQMLGLPSTPDTIDNSGNVNHLTEAIVLNGSENWGTSAGWTGNAFVLTGAIPNAQPVSGYGTVADIMCSHFPAKAPATIAVGTLGAGIGNGTEIFLGFADTSLVAFHNVAALKSWLAAHPVVIVYKRATSRVEAIAPVEINGVDGTNVVASDGVSLDLAYSGSGWTNIGNTFELATLLSDINASTVANDDFRGLLESVTKLADGLLLGGLGGILSLLLGPQSIIFKESGEEVLIISGQRTSLTTVVVEYDTTRPNNKLTIGGCSFIPTVNGYKRK